MLTVWGRANSINVQKVMWTIGELGLEHERIPTGGSFKGTDRPEYRAMNPGGLVPTIKDGETILWESNAIVRYLASRYGGEPLWPLDPAKRADADRWMDWSLSEVSPSLTPVFFATVRKPKAQHDAAAIAQAAERLHPVFRRIDDVLGRSEFIAGPALTMGDIAIGAYVARYVRMPIERPALANVQRYMDVLSSRPAFAKHILIPFGTCAEEWDANERKFG
ncbi:glutathione S-transferase [Rhodoligotrophos appendicifer]|uniref:glutathione S-transferase family protein n=1 Tax=Rhodoligotrophos appendicifer TaxID=987056 RepID=UPI0011859EFE|nr:glutathione S-transferase family protein [Rhodoligotrophos appendicifer]